MLEEAGDTENSEAFAALLESEISAEEAQAAIEAINILLGDDAA